MFLPSLFLLPEEKKPIALPRAKKARVPVPRVQKLIEEITLFYTPEAIQEFRDKVTDKAIQAKAEKFREELAEALRNKIKMKIKERQKGLKGIVQSFELENIFTKDPRKLFVESQNAISKKLAQLLQQRGPFKAYLTLQVELKKRITVDGEEAYEFAQPYFNSSTTAILNEFEIKEVYDSAVEEILNRKKWYYTIRLL